MSPQERTALADALQAWRELVFFACSGGRRYARASCPRTGPLSFESVLFRHNDFIRSEVSP